MWASLPRSKLNACCTDTMGRRPNDPLSLVTGVRRLDHEVGKFADSSAIGRDPADYIGPAASQCYLTRVHQPSDHAVNIEDEFWSYAHPLFVRTGLRVLSV